MGRFVDQIRALALAFGAPGLFLIAFLDSSFLSLPEIADLLIVWMVTQHKHRMALYVASAVLGSVCGCLVMYYLGLKGGQALVRKRFAGATVERTLATIERHGMMAVLVTSLLPPPVPLKVFVLLAGVAGISVQRFVTAIAAGRTIRYLALGLLAVEYGDQTMAYLHEHAAAISASAIVVLALGVVLYVWWAKRTHPRPTNPRYHDRNGLRQL